MGASRDQFVKYPRTPHLFGSRGTDDDKHLGRRSSDAMVADASLIVEEKLDGTNVGIHFASSGRMVLQCRGHEITEGMHPQYDLFKQWTAAKQALFHELLGGRFIMYGEWLYARHTVHYRALPHYFFEFDIYDKDLAIFLDLKERSRMLEGTGLCTVPVVHRGAITADELARCVGVSAYDAEFHHPNSGLEDHRMEGLYLRTEAKGAVQQRAKWVRPEFVEKIRQSEHWQHQKLEPNLLMDGVELWA